MLFKYVQVLSVLLVAGRALHLKLAKELGVRFSSKAKLGLQAAQRFPKFLERVPPQNRRMGGVCHGGRRLFSWGQPPILPVWGWIPKIGRTSEKCGLSKVLC